MRAKNNHLFNMRYFRANANSAVCIPMRNLSDTKKMSKKKTPKPKWIFENGKSKFY